jgi:hypothetical protein
VSELLCDCGKPWTKSHDWLRTPNVCRPCDKLRPHFDTDPPFGWVDPKDEDNPEIARPGQWQVD